MKGELTGLLPDATEVQYPVRFQYANGIESLFDKSVHDTAAGIPAVAEKVRNNRSTGSSSAMSCTIFTLDLDLSYMTMT